MHSCPKKWTLRFNTNLNVAFFFVIVSKYIPLIINLVLLWGGFFLIGSCIIIVLKYL